MSDIGFEGLAELIATILIALFLMLVIPGAIWIRARMGGSVPKWLLMSAKVLTVLSGTALFVMLTKLFL